MKLDRESLSALIKLALFLALTGLATLFLVSLLANGLFRSETEYRAVFGDVTGVAKGDDVRIAGVSVGRVKKVEIVDRDQALVTFGVDSDRPLTENTRATLKFRNLVGQRYIALSQGAEGSTGVLEAGATIPRSRTKDALDLNVLFNGFKPVFEALSPDDTNKLAFEIVQVLQGESSSVENLLATTASLTTTLAERDQLIGDVISNLGTTLDIVASRDDELSQTIVTLQQFISGLNADRDAILGSLDSISGLAEETSMLLQEGRPALAADITALRDLTSVLTSGDNLAELERNLQITPIKMKKLSNSASGGSMFNFYVCELNLTVRKPGGEPVLSLPGDGSLQLGGDRCARDPLPAAGGAS